MCYILNSYYLNLFLLLLVFIISYRAYRYRCDYSKLVKKLNQLSLTEIG